MPAPAFYLQGAESSPAALGFADDARVPAIGTTAPLHMPSTKANLTAMLGTGCNDSISDHGRRRGSLRMLKKFGKVVAKPMTMPTKGILRFKKYWDGVFWGALERNKRKAGNPEKALMSRSPLSTLSSEKGESITSHQEILPIGPHRQQSPRPSSTSTISETVEATRYGDTPAPQLELDLLKHKSWNAPLLPTVQGGTPRASFAQSRGGGARS
ncbi:hypothetical protein LTR85_001250 [Meristemomyces frigidus]|nr:hypothetical protein LTR85_001250 [Meristemomyces frigidus]